MKIELNKIYQYIDTKLYYIARLLNISETGTLTQTIIKDGIHTRAEAIAVKKLLDSYGLKGKP